MAGKTTISWCTDVWNPLRGCSRVSAGCEHCYAERQAGRFSGHGQPYGGLVRKTSGGWRWTGEIRLIEQELETPLRWRKPRRIFVNSMSDLFHDEVKEDWIDQIFYVMAKAAVWGHTFQILTKRAERMCAYLSAAMPRIAQLLTKDFGPWPDEGIVWPLRRVWLGVSVENQATADKRIPWLLRTPAAVRFVSYEPALAAVDFRPYMPNPLWNNLPSWKEPGLDWVICGGESGPHARPCDLAWLRSTITQCREAGVACWVKQLGATPYQLPQHDGSTGYMLPLKDRKGSDPAEWPDDLRVQQFPREVAP